MHQFQNSIRPEEGIPAGLQSTWERKRTGWEHQQQAWECQRQAWECQRQVPEYLGAPATELGAPATNLGALATSRGVSRITVEQSGKNNIFFGNATGAPGNHSYYLSFNDI